MEYCNTRLWTLTTINFLKLKSVKSTNAPRYFFRSKHRLYRILEFCNSCCFSNFNFWNNENPSNKFKIEKRIWIGTRVRKERLVVYGMMMNRVWGRRGWGSGKEVCRRINCHRRSSGKKVERWEIAEGSRWIRSIRSWSQLRSVKKKMKRIILQMEVFWILVSQRRWYGLFRRRWWRLRFGLESL